MSAAAQKIPDAMAVEPSSQKLRGRVQCYKDSLHYGFLVIEGLPDDLFVHENELVRSGIFEPLKQGQKILCRQGVSKTTGRPCAVDIELVPDHG